MSFICTLASGSSGNAALVSDGRTHILVDAGVSCRRIFEGLRELDLNAEDIAGVLITHEHIDHVRGLELFCRKTGAPVFMTGGTARGVLGKNPELHKNYNEIRERSNFELGSIGVSAFPTPHDTPESVGYTFMARGKKLAYLTDIGCITDEIRYAVQGSEYICLESNHDLFMLLSGSYPEYLKSRILSRRGHLSNDDCSDFICDAIEWGARSVVLCHLSRENNTPDKAYDSAHIALAKVGASCGDKIEIYVAPPAGLSHVCCY
jgi:phosphoribosyl 1,2-cyclic phosphodiesterase